MTPDDAARIQQLARVLAAGGPGALALRHVLRLALGPVPLPATVVAPVPLADAASWDDETRALRAFAQRFPGVMNGWWRDT